MENLIGSAISEILTARQNIINIPIMLYFSTNKHIYPIKHLKLINFR